MNTAHPSTQHLSEPELIAWHMDDAANPGAAAQHAAIARHVEGCDRCASLSEAIADTLRVFSAEPPPPVDLDRAWHRLRGNLPVLAPAPVRPAWWRLGLWLAPAMALLLVAALALRLHHPTLQPASPLASQQASQPGEASLPPGPLTLQPTGNAAVVERSATPATLEDHISSAERLLTEMNHADGPLSSSAQQQAHGLLLSNARYVQQAQHNGDAAEASLLEHLGRVLTTLDHEDRSREEQHHGKGVEVRLQLNTEGLLLDLRLLQQNDGPASPPQPGAVSTTTSATTPAVKDRP